MAQTQTASAAQASTQEYPPLSATLSRGRIFSILIGVILGILLAALDQRRKHKFITFIPHRTHGILKAEIIPAFALHHLHRDASAF